MKLRCWQENMETPPPCFSVPSSRTWGCDFQLAAGLRLACAQPGFLAQRPARSLLAKSSPPPCPLPLATFPQNHSLGPNHLPCSSEKPVVNLTGPEPLNLWLCGNNSLPLLLSCERPEN